MAVTFTVLAIYGLFAGALRVRLLSSDRAMAWLNRSFGGLHRHGGTIAIGAHLTDRIECDAHYLRHAQSAWKI